MVETSRTDCQLTAQDETARIAKLQQRLLTSTPTNTHEHQVFDDTPQDNHRHRAVQASQSQTRAASRSNFKTNTIFRPRLSYLPSSYLQQPLLAPHFFLAGPSGSSILAGPNGTGLLSSASGAGPTGSQFTLTPDARACVTATYLCVLIVNNTWLDCNLLEMLCNSTGTGGRHSGSGDSSNGKHDNGQDLMVRGTRNVTKWLAGGKREEFAAESALESALSGLIAFAGGDNNPEEDEGGGTNLAGDPPDATDEDHRHTVTASSSQLYVVPINLRPVPDKSRQKPIEPQDKGGGGGNTDESDSQEPKLYAAETEPPGPVLPAVDHQHQRVETSDKVSRLVDEDKNHILEQYFNLRKHRLRNKQHQFYKQRLEAMQRRQQQELFESQQGRLAHEKQFNDSNEPNDEPNTAATTQQPTALPMTSTTGSPSSLVGWMGRPFRGWGSYSFWPTSSIDPVSSSSKHQNQDAMIQMVEAAKPVQILRPIDRSEQNNDISTNQSSLKASIPSQSGYMSGEMPTSGTNNNLMPESDQDGQNNRQIASFATGSTAFPDFMLSEATQTPSRQQQAPTTFGRVAAPLSTAQGAANVIGLLTSGGTASAPPASNLVKVYDFNTQRLSRHHHQIVHQPQQHRHQFGPNPEDQEQVGGVSLACKCDNQNNEMILDDFDCRVHCTAAQQRQQQSPLASTPAPNVLLAVTSANNGNQDSAQQQPLTTSSTFATPTSTTTIGPSAKMNPLDVTFLLYTRYHRDLVRDLAQLNGFSGNNLAATASDSLVSISDIIDLTNETTLSESRLNSSLPIKIVIHGFGSGGRRPWVTDMVYKLLDYEDVNVIVVDWEKGATLPNYVQAAGNTRLVGHKIASLIKSINVKYGLTGNSFHLIGFSLGAHVAGFAGMEIRNSTSVARHWINRITGLDPASPLFEGYEANDRLDPSDAQFVDVIHSNGDGVLRGGFGSLQPMGHVDFYPNGGRVQVGCNSVIISALSDIIYGKWQSLCNHRRALNFFMDSFEFSKCRFRSFSCDSYENYLKGECFDCGLNNEKCSYMGYLANYSKGRGKMYLTTHEEAPFCANQFIIKIIGSKGYKTHWGKVEVTLVTIDGKNESFLLSSMNGQTSGGHESSGGHKELIQHSMQSLIVAHPTLVNFTHVLLRYTKYKGWIYSGDESWPIDKVFITDSDGQVKSFCGINTILESHITTRLNLEPGNCTVIEPTIIQQAGTISGGVPLANQQMPRALGAPPGNLLAVGPAQQVQAQESRQQQEQQLQQQQQQQQPQSQQQQSSQQPQPQQQSGPQQQQQSQSQQSQARTPRRFASIMQPTGGSDVAPLLAHGHAFQRMAPGPAQFGIGTGLPQTAVHQIMAF